MCKVLAYNTYEMLPNSIHSPVGSSMASGPKSPAPGARRARCPRSPRLFRAPRTPLMEAQASVFPGLVTIRREYLCCGCVFNNNDLAAPELCSPCCSRETFHITADFLQEAHDWICCAGREALALSRVLAGMALNPYAKPFLFKPTEPIRGDAGASPTGPLSSDETLHATSAKLERLRLASRGPELDQNLPQNTSGTLGTVLAPEALDAEELVFDDVFYQSVLEETPAFTHCRTEVWQSDTFAIILCVL